MLSTPRVKKKKDYYSDKIYAYKNTKVMKECFGRLRN